MKFNAQNLLLLAAFGYGVYTLVTKMRAGATASSGVALQLPLPPMPAASTEYPPYDMSVREAQNATSYGPP